MANSLIILDDWHLNQNQRRNTENEARRSGGQWTGKEISNDLHDMCRSRGMMSFQAKRTAFETKYFSNRATPRWYNSLYREMPEMVVSCFNRKICRLRFKFKGSGYAETGS